MTTTVLPVTADTDIFQEAPTTNRSTLTSSGMGEYNGQVWLFRGLWQFAGLNDGTIPSSDIVSSAILTLTTATDASANARNHRIFRLVRSDAVIAQATWNIYKTGSNWSTAGAFHADDCEQTDIGLVNMANNVAANTAVNFTLGIAAIQAIVSGEWASNILFGKVDTESNDCYLYHSKEAATEAYRPYLTITHTMPKPYRTRRGINLLGRQGRRLVF